MPGVESAEREDLHDREVRGIERFLVDGAAGVPARRSKDTIFHAIAARVGLRGAGD
jgi:hypothetical protein